MIFYKKKTENKSQKYKPIPLDKYIILCEKEAIIAFLCEIAPYAYVPKRINNGREKGDYKVIAAYSDFLDLELSNESYQDENNEEIVLDYLKTLKCDFANFEFHTGNWTLTPQAKKFGWYDRDYKQEVTLIFRIHQSFRESIIKDYEVNVK